MIRSLRAAGLPARLFMLAREAFEASVAIHYYAPWKASAPTDSEA
jgi:hypothetical protein